MVRTKENFREYELSRRAEDEQEGGEKDWTKRNAPRIKCKEMAKKNESARLADGGAQMSSSIATSISLSLLLLLLLSCDVLLAATAAAAWPSHGRGFELGGIREMEGESLL